MRVLLIAVNTERINMRVLPLGLAEVAAAARRAGHETRLLDLGPGDYPEATIARAWAALPPDVVGLSVRNIDNVDMRRARFLLPLAAAAVAACRAAGAAPIVVGGAGYSIFPRAALERLGADYGVRGEGETAFPARLETIARGGDAAAIPGVLVRGGGGGSAPARSVDLDRFPAADFAAWSDAAADPELLVPVQTRRGCAMDCAYCSTALIEGRALRFRAVESVVRDLRAVADAGFRRVFFVDNVFNEPEAYALELCRAIAALGAPLEFRAIVYPRRLSPELARAMAAAGCVETSLGFESGDPGVLRALGKRFSPDDVRAVSDALAERGVRRRGFLLIGGPGETMDTVARSLAFAASLKLDGLKTTVGIRIYPGTPLAAAALREGVVAPDDDLLEPRFYLSPALRDHLDELPPPDPLP